MAVLRFGCEAGDPRQKNTQATRGSHFSKETLRRRQKKKKKTCCFELKSDKIATAMRVSFRNDISQGKSEIEIYINSFVSCQIRHGIPELSPFLWSNGFIDQFNVNFLSFWQSKFRQFFLIRKTRSFLESRLCVFLIIQFSMIFS